MVECAPDHEDNHIMIVLHVDVIKDLHFEVLDSKNNGNLIIALYKLF